jgi:hypothetical protein
MVQRYVVSQTAAGANFLGRSRRLYYALRGSVPDRSTAGTALKRDIPVIPILVDGAMMPAVGSVGGGDDHDRAGRAGGHCIRTSSSLA